MDLLIVYTPDKIGEDYPTRKPNDLTQKQTITIKEIMNYKGRKLIIGSAGIGKSSLAQKITVDWAANRQWNVKYTYVFHFRCRDLAEQCSENLTLKELLTEVHIPDISMEFDTDELINTFMKHRNKVLIIIDGLDELPAWDSQARNNEFTQHEFPINKQTNIADLINGLICGLVIPGVQVLTTTRPMETLSRLIGIKHILILGFNEKSVRKCIKSICENDTKQHPNDNFYPQTMEFLQSNPIVMNLCAVPFMCTLFALVALESLKEHGQIGIANMTQLITLAIRHIIKRRNLEWNLTLSQQTRILDLTLLASRCTLRKDLKVIFTSADMEQEDGEVLSGLLECFKEKRIERKPQTYFSFIHLLIQEFLTALHVCLNKEEVTNFSKVGLTSQRLDNVHLFMAGLLGDKDMGHEFIEDIKPDVENLMTIQELLPVISSQGDNSKLKKLQLTRCAHEGQMSDMMGDIRTLVMEEDGKKLDLSDTPGGLLPHHLASVGWFIQESQCVEVLE